MERLYNPNGSAAFLARYLTIAKFRGREDKFSYKEQFQVYFNALLKFHPKELTLRVNEIMSDMCLVGEERDAVLIMMGVEDGDYDKSPKRFGPELRSRLQTNNLGELVRGAKEKYENYIGMPQSLQMLFIENSIDT